MNYKIISILGIILIVSILFSVSFVASSNYSCMPEKVKGVIKPTAGFTALTGVKELPMDVSKGTLILSGFKCK